MSSSVFLLNTTNLTLFFPWVGDVAQFVEYKALGSIPSTAYDHVFVVQAYNSTTQEVRQEDETLKVILIHH